MQFVKMHGLGNDFIIFPEEETGGVSSWPSFSLKFVTVIKGWEETE